MHIGRLQSEHRELMALARRLSAAIAAPQPAPQVELFELRRKLASALIAHLKVEDWALYPALFDHHDPAVAEAARRFSDEMGGLASAFAVYSERWTTMTIQANWNGFCTESADIISALIKRIEREETELYPLATRTAKAA
jgi:hemerythrin-like domain-containing protein